MKGNTLLILLCVIAVYFSFWKLGADPLNEWDESRRGVNAMEMLQNGDPVNMYYGGKPDTWNAKPPLMVWLIALSFKVFGYNEFALRFPSALAIFFSFIIIYRLILLYADKAVAFLTCISLLSVNGLVGNHVGRTGDVDALLIFFLLLSILFFLKYLDFNYTKGLYYSAVFMGLAFYTKGFASLIILPGLFLYTVAFRKIGKLFKDKRLWIAAGIFLSFVTSWVLILYKYGLTFTESVFGSRNTLETLWKYDIIQRFTEGVDHQEKTHNYLYFFNYLDINFNIWNYVFYVVLAFIIYGFARHRQGQFLKNDYQRKLMVVSLALVLSIGLLLSLVKETHIWYMAPALPFIALITVIGIREITEQYRYFIFIVSVVFVFTFTRKIIDINTSGSYPDFLTSSEKVIKSADRVITYNLYRQDYLLYLKMHNPQVQVLKGSDSIKFAEKEVVIVSRDAYIQSDSLKANTRLISGDEQFVILMPE